MTIQQALDQFINVLKITDMKYIQLILILQK